MAGAAAASGTAVVAAAAVSSAPAPASAAGAAAAALSRPAAAGPSPGWARPRASRRPPGTPLTWAEAIVGASLVFGVLLLAYGVVPNQWLQWADNQLHWRQDAYGIPTGPLPFHHHVLFEHGITFFGGHGRVLIT